MGLYEEFRFHPAPWLPHSDLPLEELERIRNIKREDMEYTNENGYSVKVVMNDGVETMTVIVSEAVANLIAERIG